MQGEKAAFRPCAYTEGALTHHGQTLVPGADRRYLRLEGGGRCVVEPTDYSAGRSIAATLELPEAGPQGQMQRHLRRKGPKTKGKIEILHSVKERPKRPMRGLASETGETTHSWQRARVPARACRQGSEAACREKMPPRQRERPQGRGRAAAGTSPRDAHPYKWGKQFAGHTGLTKALGGVQFYFCDPHHLWQKPTVKNTNGLLLEFFP
jgi:hypothetical protein